MYIKDEDIEWLLNGEKAEADILNRPMRQIVRGVNDAFEGFENSEFIDDIYNKIEDSYDEIFEVIKDGNGFARGDRARLIFNNEYATVSITAELGHDEWHYYFKGRKIVSDTIKTYTLSAQEKVGGGFYLSFNADGQLVNTGPHPDFYETTLCFYVHYSNGEFIIAGDERHASDRDTAWHHSHHREDGMVIYTLGDIIWTVDDTNNTGIQLTSTLVADEDLQHLITHSLTGEEPFRQIIEGDKDEVVIPTLYYDGSIRYLPNKKLPWVVNSLKYNDGITLMDVPNGKFVNYFLVASNCQEYPIKLIMGRKVFDDVEDTVNETLESFGLNFPEMAMLYRIAIERDETASTPGKCKLKLVQQAASRITFESQAGNTSSGLSNHAQLLGRNEPNAHPLESITDLVETLSTKVDKTTKIIPGTGLSGGGDLSTDRTLTVKYGSDEGTAAEGNDSRLSDSREWTADTVSQTEAELGASTERKAWTAERVRQANVAWWNSASGAFGKDIITSTTSANARLKLGLGDSSTRNVGTIAGTVAAGDDPRFDSVSKTADWEFVTNKPATATRWPAHTEVTGLGNVATRNIGTTSGTVAAGNDTRFSDSREWTAATISQAEAEAGTATTRRAWTAQRVRQSNVAYWNSVTGVFGRDLITSSTNAIARQKLALSDAAITTVAAIRAGTTWANVQSKPATATRWPTWAEVTGKPAIPAVSQTTGQNTTTVMSQKAVTDALDKAGSSGIADKNNILFKGAVKEDVEFNHISVSRAGGYSVPSSPHRNSSFVYPGGFSCKQSYGDTYTYYTPLGIAVGTAQGTNVMQITGSDDYGMYAVQFKSTVHVDGGFKTKSSAGSESFIWARDGFRVSPNGISGVTAQIAANGVATFLSVTETSDDRYKDKKEIIGSPLYKLSKISGYTYDLYNDKDKTEFVKRSVGVIAQDVEKVLPECVEDSDKKTVSYSGVTALLVESVKELMQKVESLEKEIKILKQGN